MIMNIPDCGAIKKTDWGRIQSAANVLWAEISAGRWNQRQSSHEHYGSLYQMGSYGNVTVGTAHDDSRWMFWSGPWLESLLPWAQKIRDKMIVLGMPIFTIAYHNHTYSIKAHRDNTNNESGSDGISHTNINYMISSLDPDNSYTWCRDDQGNEMRYYSHPGKLWLINASNIHAIETRSYRDALIIKLLYPYEQVEKFVIDNPDFLNVD